MADTLGNRSFFLTSVEVFFLVSLNVLSLTGNILVCIAVYKEQTTTHNHPSVYHRTCCKWLDVRCICHAFCIGCDYNRRMGLWPSDLQVSSAHGYVYGVRFTRHHGFNSILTGTWGFVSRSSNTRESFHPGSHEHYWPVYGSSLLATVQFPS